MMTRPRHWVPVANCPSFRSFDAGALRQLQDALDGELAVHPQVQAAQKGPDPRDAVSLEP
jgi:hypothetical protein